MAAGYPSTLMAEEDKGNLQFLLVIYTEDHEVNCFAGRSHGRASSSPGLREAFPPPLKYSLMEICSPVAPQRGWCCGWLANWRARRGLKAFF